LSTASPSPPFLLPSPNKYIAPSLTPLAGGDVGSTKIDEQFEESATQRLEQLRGYVFFDNDAASKMMHGRFQEIKCAFGPEENFKTFSIRVPGMPHDYSNDTLGFMRGKMVFTGYVCLCGS
jgi:hypothetical protein